MTQKQLGSFYITLSALMYGSYGVWSKLMAGIKRLEPSVGGIIGLSEVVFAILLGVLLFAEPITSSVLIGGLLIILSASLNDGVELLQKKKK